MITEKIFLFLNIRYLKSIFLWNLRAGSIYLVVLLPLGLVTGIFGTSSPASITFGSVIPLAIYGIVNVAGMMILLGSLAEAYRQLGGPGIGVPEETLAVFDA